MSVGDDLPRPIELDGSAVKPYLWTKFLRERRICEHISELVLAALLKNDELGFEQRAEETVYVLALHSPRASGFAQRLIDDVASAQLCGFVPMQYRAKKCSNGRPTLRW